MFKQSQTLARKGFTIMLAAAASTVLAANAFSADFGQPAAQAGYDWSGVYIGATAGYNWGKDRTAESGNWLGFPVNAIFGYDVDGASGGVKAGVNFQTGSFVYGAEADIEAANISGGFVDRVQNAGIGSDKYDWQASIRARMGYAVDRAMIYGTGGVSFAHIENTYSQVLIPPHVSESFDKVRTGWTVGGGVDYALTDNVILGAEYRYTNFNAFSNVSATAFPGVTGEQNPATHALRLSISYKF